ncbi:MAG TPA: cupin domain-containing protein [Coriobacteriia bacterium]|nr:cupin domain-containing protein [Coriobacteriia bacterium]
MLVSGIERERIVKTSAGVGMLPLLSSELASNEAVDIGYAEFTPGLRSPVEGSAAHDADEIAYVLSGSIHCVSGGRLHTVHAGEVSYIPAGEAHYSYTDEGESCTLVYALVKTAAPSSVS